MAALRHAPGDRQDEDPPEGERLTYRYDFGDDWDHLITVEKILAPEPGVRYPRCVAGRRACPPEDVGGPWGYQEFLAAMADPAHDDHQHYRDWIGGTYDAAEFSAAEADEAFDTIGWQPLTLAQARTTTGGRA